MQIEEVLQVWGSSLNNKLVALPDNNSQSYIAAGNGKKKIVVFAIPQSNAAQDLIILERLLTASKLTMDDIYFVDGSNCQLSLANINAQFLPQLLVLFNITPKQLELFAHVKYNKTINWLQTNLLFCVSLQTIDTDKNLKREFWNAWQQAINII
jgi:hypothetical protein